MDSVHIVPVNNKNGVVATGLHLVGQHGGETWLPGTFYRDRGCEGPVKWKNQVPVPLWALRETIGGHGSLLVRT